ncbi:MAG: septum formation protein Maf [Clostridia bacterium]|nr:septum formation protein Maf [Clostridia bacterium]
MKIILASGSPRRREILGTLGLEFEIIVPDVDESSDTSDPAELVRELSLRKATAVRDMLAARGENLSDVLIIASDTLVYCGGEILGKPHDRADATRMLRLMSGRAHSVFSGIAVCLSDAARADFCETRVRFADIPEPALERYLDSCKYMDKAGAYAIQEGAALFIEGIEGDFFNVVGLPVRRLFELLRDSFGIDIQSLCSPQLN